jgi:hypothetical protein
MHYTYNAIFRIGPLNTFEAALYSGYLCLKISATFGVISVFNSQKDVRNIEQCFTPDHKNVYFLREESEQYQQLACPLKSEALAQRQVHKNRQSYLPSLIRIATSSHGQPLTLLE